MSRTPRASEELNRMTYSRISHWYLVATLATTITASAAQTPSPAVADTRPASSAATAVPGQVPPLNGIAHIAIRVKDIAASVAFYNKLGFEQAFAMNKGDVITQSFIKINDRQFIELYPVTDRDPQVGFLHLCFEGADLNAIHDSYIAEGLTPISVRKAGAGNLLFTMKGPEQFSTPQNIEYTEYMPGSLHSNDFGKHLGPDRIADMMVVVLLAMQDPPSARDFYQNKLNFVAVAGGSRLAWPFGLPGTSGEAVEIVPVETLGPRSSIILSSPDIHHTGELLQSKGVPFEDGDFISVTDPDGNTIRIMPRKATGVSR